MHAFCGIMCNSDVTSMQQFTINKYYVYHSKCIIDTPRHWVT